MNTIRTIDEELLIPHAALDRNLSENILEILKLKESTCNKSYGYIGKIISLDAIIDSRISAGNSQNHVTIRYTFESIKPDIGTILSGSIAAVFEDGVFSDTNGFKTLGIGGKFDNGTYTCSCGMNLSVGDVVSFVITDIEFKSNTFFCVGTHHHA